MPDLSLRETQYFSGQGQLFIGPVGGYDPAVGVGFRWMGDVSQLAITPEEEATDVKESWSGQRSVVRRNVTERRMGVAITMRDFSPDNIALLVSGSRVLDTFLSFADEDIGDPDIEVPVQLDHRGVSNVVIVDSDSPANVLPVDQYTVDSAAGTVTITDKTTGGPYVAPFKASGEHRSVEDEDLGNPPVGEMIDLAHQGVSGLVIVDSTGSPKTLPATQYAVDGPSGSLTIFDKTTGGPYVAPFKAGYIFEDRIALPFFTIPSGSRVMLRFLGLNTAESEGGVSLPVLVELYSVELTPGQTLPLIGDETADFEVQAQARLDDTREAIDALGQFGRVVIKPPPEEVAA